MSVFLFEFIKFYIVLHFCCYLNNLIIYNLKVTVESIVLFVTNIDQILLYLLIHTDKNLIIFQAYELIGPLQ